MSSRSDTSGTYTDAYAEYQEQLNALARNGDLPDSYSSQMSVNSDPHGSFHSDLDDLGEDIAPLLGPTADESTHQLRKAYLKQQKHLNFQCTPRVFICVGAISVIDLILLMVEFGLNHGWNAGSWWSNISAGVLMTMGAKDTALIQKGQVWRLVTPMFLHVGLLHCIVNILTQLSLSVQIESALGIWKTAFIYLVSGVGGNLASAIFLPNLPEVGASSSIFGLVGVYFVDLIVNWSVHPNRIRNLIILIVTTVISFGLGFFPHIDNFAHLGGFIIGVVAAFIVMPNVSTPSFVPSKTRKRFRRKILRITVSCVLLVILFATGIVVLFSGLNLDHWCGFCEYISCLPIFPGCQVTQDGHKRFVDLPRQM